MPLHLVGAVVRFLFLSHAKSEPILIRVAPDLHRRVSPRR